MTVFLRLLQDREKAGSLIESCASVRSSKDDPRIFFVAPKRFQSVPGSPFAYWASSSIISMFTGHTSAESGTRRFTKGLCTTDDFRFVRLWWEPSNSNADNKDGKWFSFANGSKTRSFYFDPHLALNWCRDGIELKSYLDQKIGKPNQWSRWINSVDYYFRPGVTWPLRTARFSPQVLPSGVIFSIRSYAGFEEGDQALAMIGVLSSRPFDYLFKVSLGRFGYPEFVIGVVQKMPYPVVLPEERETLELKVRQSWELWRALSTVEETSHAFYLPAALRARLGDYDPPSIEAELAVIQAEIDDIAFHLYGFSDADRAAALGSSGAAGEDASDAAEDADDSEDDDGAEPIDQADGLLSWAVGVAFGRFDWRLATGERDAPPEPDPFDPLPAKSPGMLPDGAEPFHAHTGILVDDKGHPNDLARLIEEVLARVQADVPGDVRRWLQRDFFPLHLKQYNKSRRKAPIYWPLSTNSGSYTLWLYYPSLTSQTLYTAVNDFVEPKLKQVSRDAATLRDKGAARSRDDEKAFEALQTLELELSELRDTLLQIAPIYRPNHDDGVQITAAPLWQLFRHKPWQKILKDTWAKLGKGDYDWAHLAMAYWPDRVREKCKADKSLAIAHDLGNLYVEPEAQPKKARKKRSDA